MSSRRTVYVLAFVVVAGLTLLCSDAHAFGLLDDHASPWLGGMRHPFATHPQLQAPYVTRRYHQRQRQPQHQGHHVNPCTTFLSKRLESVTFETINSGDHFEIVSSPLPGDVPASAVTLHIDSDAILTIQALRWPARSCSEYAWHNTGRRLQPQRMFQQYRVPEWLHVHHVQARLRSDKRLSIAIPKALPKPQSEIVHKTKQPVIPARSKTRKTTECIEQHKCYDEWSLGDLEHLFNKLTQSPPNKQQQSLSSSIPGEHVEEPQYFHTAVASPIPISNPLLNDDFMDCAEIEI